MADADELRELRAQRHKVAQHLQWLDQLISDCETQSSAAAESEQAPVSKPQEAPEHRPLPSPPSDIGPQFDPQMVKSSIRMQSFGCIAIAVLVVAIAFFTLWILPSFIYD